VAKDEPRADATLGWHALLEDQLKAIEVDGNHRTIMAFPHVAALGAALTRALLIPPPLLRIP
jgi:thioesterase domain-containing protein